MAIITLTQLTEDDREQFILDNQRAFKYGATEEFGMRDNHFEEDGEIISRKTIENSIDHGTAWLCRLEGGRAALSGDRNLGDLYSVFRDPEHSFLRQ